MTLEKDKYYRYNNQGYDYLFKVISTCCRDGQDFKALRISGANPGFESKSSFYNLEKYCDLATQEQIEWLDACIVANKYMPQSEVKLKLDPNKVEIFPGWFVGDVIVRVGNFRNTNVFSDGSLTSIHRESSQGKLVIYWEGNKIGSYWSDSRCFRKATTEEIEAFYNGITNIADMKKGTIWPTDWCVVTDGSTEMGNAINKWSKTRGYVGNSAAGGYYYFKAGLEGCQVGFPAGCTLISKGMFLSKYGEVKEDSKPKKLLGAALIAEAKARFPIGTRVVRCLTGQSPNQSFTVKDYNHYCLHKDGKWAEIASNSGGTAYWISGGLSGTPISIDSYHPSPKKVNKKHDEPILIHKPKKITRLVVVKN